MESKAYGSQCGKWSEGDVPVLRGVLAPDLTVLFVGFEPGPADIRLRHHHARRNNQFWRLLAHSELTPRRLRPEEDEALPRWGLGLLNAVSRRRTGEGGARRGDLEAIAPRLVEVMRLGPPRILAFVGKGAYLTASGRPSAPWGRQPTSLFEGVPEVVLPSPSGKVRMTFVAKLRYYEEAAGLARQV